MIDYLEILNRNIYDYLEKNYRYTHQDIKNLIQMLKILLLSFVYISFFF